MSICLAHKIALEPPPEQRLFFDQAAGTARFTYNWALAEWKERYASGEKPKGHLLKKAFNRKAHQRVAKIHARISHVRTDSLHKLTSTLSDMGWGECRRQLEYKAPLFDGQLHIIGRFEPSSKMCHRCQTVKKVLSLGERLFVCNACGHIEDRDLNAAKNIHQLGQAMPEVTPVESRALVLIPIGTKLNSLKQERTRAHFCARER